MKRFILKLSIFIMLVISILAVFIFLSDYFLKNSACNAALEDKIYAFSDAINTAGIIIAGDSRAEKQLSPAIIERKTRLKTINIAVSSCDLITLYNGLKKYNILNTGKTIIISVSSFQINDGATGLLYLSPACLYNMTLIEKIKVFKKDPLQLLYLYRDGLFTKTSNFLIKKVLKKRPSLNINSSAYKEKGFNPEDGLLNAKMTISLNPEKTGHPWYKRVSLNGAKRRVFSDALSKFGESKCKIIIYNPPASFAWKTYTKNSFIENMEKDFSKLLAGETKKYKNMTFIDFYAKTYPELTNDHYVDIQHLNRRGAEIFTNLLTDDPDVYCLFQSRFFRL